MWAIVYPLLRPFLPYLLAAGVAVAVAAWWSWTATRAENVALQIELRAANDKLSQQAEQIKQCNAQAAKVDQRERKIADVLARRSDVVAQWLRNNPMSARAAEPSNTGDHRAAEPDRAVDPRISACEETDRELTQLKEALKVQFP